MFFLIACSDYHVYEAPPVPPAEPLGTDADNHGDPPDWTDCWAGYLGQYYNLPSNHVDMDIEKSVGELDTLDWWSESYHVWEGWDASLDFGENWWPVDDGLAGDPAYFAVQWTSWLRAHDDVSLEVTFGAATDGWLLVDGDIVFSTLGSNAFAPETIGWALDAGQYPIEIRMAQRGGRESGFRFRVLSGDVEVCAGDYTE